MRLSSSVLLTMTFIFAYCSTSSAQTGTLALPFPEPAQNAALHYQRGILFLRSISDEQQPLLDKPLAELLGSDDVDTLKTKVRKLLNQGRPALEAAESGAKLTHCDFGIDFSKSGSASLLPHVPPMVELGRLLTLRGAVAEADGDWAEAAAIYFDGLRMGRHLTHQHTLLEAVSGGQILANNYYALGHWATHCPSEELVVRVFGLMESLAPDMVNPAQIVVSEGSILRMDFDAFRDAYPNGPWAQLVFDSLEETVPQGDRGAQASAAKKLLTDRGTPEKVFESEKAFLKYVDQLEHAYLRFIEASATCMTLPPEARVKRGQIIYERYSKLLGPLGGELLVNPAEVGVLFAGHDAELQVLRVTLAAAAGKTEDGFPSDVAAIAKRFGGTLPVSPYDGSPVKYELSDDGKSFSVSIDEVSVGDWTLPAVRFESAPPVQVAAE